MDSLHRGFDSASIRRLFSSVLGFTLFLFYLSSGRLKITGAVRAGPLSWPADVGASQLSDFAAVHVQDKLAASLALNKFHDGPLDVTREGSEE
jgi:hypothetical protein